MPINISAPPYFDDFDDTKDYQAILFKPGFAVQTRELNQIQTIQQNQIEQFGNSIYSSGSIVSGGKSFFNNKVYSVKLLPTYGGSAINVAPLIKTYAKGATSGLIAEILFVIPATPSTSNTLIFQNRGAGNNSGLFIDAELINIYSDQACLVPLSITMQVATATTNVTTCSAVANNNYITVASTTGIKVGDRIVTPLMSPTSYVASITGSNIYPTQPINFNIPGGTSVTFSTDNTQPSSLASINTGVYYVDGYFLQVNPQTIVLDPYTRSSNYIIGLTYDYQIVTSAQDATLLDNASGSYNYAAPGADRLQIPLIWTKIPLVSNGDPSTYSLPNFFEIMRVNNGTLVQQTNQPIYSEIGKAMAKMSYDTNGNFLVKPFSLNLTNSQFDTALMANISAGTAFVKGNEVSTITNTQVLVPRALDTQSITSFDVASLYGDYVIVSAPTDSLPNINSGLLVEIHNVASGWSSGTKIGTANIRYMTYNSGATTSAIYNLYLFNIAMTGTNLFTSALSFITQTSSYSTITLNLPVNSAGILSGATQLYNSNYNSMLFDIPQNYISTVPLVQYNTRRTFKGVTFSSGIATITANNGNEQFLGGSGVIPSSSAVEYFTVVATSTGGSLTAGQFVPLDSGSRTVTIPVVGSGSPGQAIINVNSSSFNGTCDIEASIFCSADARRTKTLVSNATLSNASPTFPLSLAKSDCYAIVGIYDSGNPSVAATTSSTNVTANYSFDNGQRDAYYDFGSINLIPGATALVGQILVVFDYFTQGGGTGYYSVDSYSIPYSNIPTYTDSSGVTHQLRDCIDFRPRRTDGSSSILFPTFQIPDPTNIIINESYYLSRIDKIVMTSTGNINLLTGVSAYTNPQPPADLPDAMTMYTLVLPAYTASPSDVQIIYQNNRRYTMQDIAAIDTRLSNVEYYTALSQLEQAATSQILTNLTGTELYQNGLLTEPFVDFTVADVGNADFSCSIDTVGNIARAPFTMTNVPLNWYSTGSTAELTGSLVTAPYTQSPIVNQTLASQYVNVNPFNVFSNIGTLTLTPNSDTWYDTTALPVITSTDASSAAFAIAQSNALATNQNANWGEWQTNWTGSVPTVVGGSTVSSATPTNASSNAVSLALIPYMRSSTINFSATGLTPYTSIFAWMDGVILSSYVTPASIPTSMATGITNYNTVGGSGWTTAPAVTITGTGTGASAHAVVLPSGAIAVIADAYGTGYTGTPTVTLSGGTGGSGASATAIIGVAQIGMPLITDVHGNCSGTITIPDNSNQTFVTGNKVIIFSSNSTNSITATSYATATYSALGYVQPPPPYVPPYVPPPKPIIPAVAPENPPTFAGSPPTVGVSAAVLAVMANLGYPSTYSAIPDIAYSSLLAQAEATVGGAISAYNTNPITVADPGRSIVSPTTGAVVQTGLPDFGGTVYWATQTIQKGLASGIQVGIGEPAYGIAVAATTASAASVTNQGIVTDAVNIEADTGKYPPIVDPVAQQIFVDVSQNPNGIFVSSLDLYFASKDTYNPIIVEIRPDVNGYPSSTAIMPNSQVTVNPSAINISTNGNVLTNVTFSQPVFLAPGTYYIVIKSNSDAYTVFVAEMGQVILGQSATVTTQPYVGSFFESKNSATWTAEQNLVLTFTLYQCVFELGTTQFFLNGIPESSTYYYDIINITSQGQNFGTLTNLSSQLATYPEGGGSISSYSNFIPNSNNYFNTRQQIVGSTDLMVKYEITTTNTDISPTIDVSRSSAILVKNIINNSSDWTVPETTSSHGSASAKYVSKKVILASGQAAENLVVYLDVDRPPSTSIQVYYKIQNQFDTSNFTSLPWVLLSQEVNGGYTAQQGQTVQDKWSAYNITYTNGSNTYSSFVTYQIKIVLVSSNPSLSPTIANIREIALT